MKITLALISSLIFIIGLKHFTNPVFIKGQLKNGLSHQSIELGLLEVIVKADGKVRDTAYADFEGQFELSFVVGKEKSFDFFCYGLGMDTILLGSMKKFESDVVEMIFNVPLERKKNKLGQVLCPKCNRADRVFKIAYGAGMAVRMEVLPTGDTTFSNLINGRYVEGTCIVGIARHYCDRDRAKF